jgi:probable HAF family extracellular repeat protein
MKRYLCSLIALGLVVGVTGRAMAQPSYTFSTLDVPGSSYAFTSAFGINVSGQIVGEYADAVGAHGFLYDQGSFTTVAVPGSHGTHPRGINASGQIVGSYYDDASGPPYFPHGFLLDQGGYTTLDVPGSTATSANGINASGQIVGYYYDAAARLHGFLLDQGNSMCPARYVPQPKGSTPRAKSWERTTMLLAMAMASCTITVTTPRSTGLGCSLPLPAGSTPRVKSWAITTMLPDSTGSCSIMGATPPSTCPARTVLLLMG